MGTAGAGLGLFKAGADPAALKVGFAMLGIAMVVGYVDFIVLVQSFFASRMQNLLLNRTKSTRIRFESA